MGSGASKGKSKKQKAGVVSFLVAAPTVPVQSLEVQTGRTDNAQVATPPPKPPIKPVDIFSSEAIDKQQASYDAASQIADGCQSANISSILSALQELKKIKVEEITDPLLILNKLLGAIGDDSTTWQAYHIKSAIAQMAHQYLHMVFYVNRRQGKNIPGPMIDSLRETVAKIKQTVQEETVGANSLYHELDCLDAGIAILFDKSASEQKQDEILEITKFVLNVGILATQQAGNFFTLGVAGDLIGKVADVTGLGGTDAVIDGLMRFAKMLKEKYRGRWYMQSMELHSMSNAASINFDALTALQATLKEYQGNSKIDWQVLYSGIDSLYRVIDVTTDAKIRVQAFLGTQSPSSRLPGSVPEQPGQAAAVSVVAALPGIISFINFSNYKFCNNWRIREKALECCIMLANHQDPQISEMVANILLEIKISETDPRVKNLFANADYIKRFQVALTKTWEQKKDEVAEKLDQQTQAITALEQKLAAVLTQPGQASEAEELKAQIQQQSATLSGILANIGVLQQDTGIYLKNFDAIKSQLERQAERMEQMAKTLTHVDTNVEEILKILSSDAAVLKIKKRNDEYWANEANKIFLKEIMQQYVSLRGKFRRDDSDESSFPLKERVEKFCSEDTQKALLLGANGGGGKSTFCELLELEKWEKGDYVPVFINLTSLKDPVKDLIEESFEKMGIARAQVAELKCKYKFLFILDGYDEMSIEKRQNLYDSNRLGEFKDSKVIITCRNEFIQRDYENLFAPSGNQKLLETIYVADFNESQIKEFLTKFLQHRAKEFGVTWQLEDYWGYIDRLPALRQIAGTPIILKMIAEELPRVIKTEEEEIAREQGKTKRAILFEATGFVNINEKMLYSSFMQSWFNREEDKLRKAGKLLVEGDVKKEFWYYAQELADKMHKDDVTSFTFYKKQRGQQPSYWDVVFANSEDYPEAQKAICFHALPLRKLRDNSYIFWNLTMLSFFVEKKGETILQGRPEEETDIPHLMGKPVLQYGFQSKFFAQPLFSNIVDKLAKEAQRYALTVDVKNAYRADAWLEGSKLCISSRLVKLLTTTALTDSIESVDKLCQSIVEHEIKERNLMRTGITQQKAHHLVIGSQDFLREYLQDVLPEQDKRYWLTKEIRQTVKDGKTGIFGSAKKTMDSFSNGSVEDKNIWELQ